MSAPRPDAAELVNGLWIGGDLPPLAVLTIRSYQDHGFTFRLFTYGAVTNVPEGTIVGDASTILAEEDLYTHANGSLSPAADWFRYRLLAREGGIWTDMDVACLRPFELPDVWFAFQSSDVAAVGLVKFPAGHKVPVWLEKLAEDPAAAMPWDSPAETAAKQALLASTPDVVRRRIEVKWGIAGPSAFTRAVGHFGLWDTGADAKWIYPVHYTIWRHAFNGRIGTDDPVLAGAYGVHLWGEMLRRDPDAFENMDSRSLVATLLKRHRCPGFEAPPPPRILVGICSARKYGDKRQAVRDTWMSRPMPGIECLFFVGRGEEPVESGPDLVVVDADDGYEALPEKVLGFFDEALKHREFDWLFKCDDDTYLALDRLGELVDGEHDFVGNEFLERRGSPSGGAGYLLSRELVQKLSDDTGLALSGPEDVIIGEAAMGYGAKARATTRLCWNRERYPQPKNDVITSHWCSPERLDAIHQFLHGSPEREFQVFHRHWNDHLALYENGFFNRLRSGCGGRWREDEPGHLVLEWFQWPAERVTRSGQGYRNEAMYLHPMRGQRTNRDASGTGVRKIDLRSLPVVVTSGWRFEQRREEIASMLADHGFQPPRFFTSELRAGAGRNWSSITFNHLAAVSSQPPPFILLEDDARPTRWFGSVIEVPEDASAVWLGVTEYGMDGTVPKAGAARLTGHPRCPRVENMLGTHAILFLDTDFTEAVRDELLQTLRTSPQTPHDRITAAMQERWNVHGVNPPLFFQDDGHVPCVTNAELEVVP
ncbi:glycosyltransferase [Luteolibacter sp. LG18]|uniref:glycosyltransferase n=1 Tax=Luteolibacter sp. LG18 TaxID=2819286 RepID=UPI0030C782DF